MREDQALRPTGASSGVPPAALTGPEQLARRVGRSQLVRLGSNESPYGPPPRAIAAMQEAAYLGHRYGDPSNHALREVLAARHGVKPEQVCVGVGVDHLLGLVVEAWLRPGVTPICSLGVFPTFDMHVNAAGQPSRKVPYRVLLPGEGGAVHGEAAMDLEGLVQAARESGPSLVYLANPDNPTGSSVPWSRVVKLLDALPPDSLLILDEAYTAFMPPEHRPPESWIDPRVIRMRTFSKEYGLAGLRIGYCLAAEASIKALDDVRLLYGVSRVAQAAALAALDDQPWVDEVVRRLASDREELVGWLRGQGGFTPGSCTSFVLLDLGTRARAEQLVGDLLAAGIHIRKPGQPPLDRFVRISVGTPDEMSLLKPLLVEAITAAAGR